MKNLLPFVIVSLLFCVSSCNQNSDECTAGIQQISEFGPINATTAAISNESQGIRTYRWDLAVPLASTAALVTGKLELFIDANALQLPIEVTMYRFVNQSVNSQTLSSTNGDLYYYLDETNLNLAFDDCSGGISYRFTVSFQTTGVEAQDDNYINSIIEGSSRFNVRYYKVED